MFKPMDKMTWLDLYNFLHKQANNINSNGKFPWQEPVLLFDFGTLQYYDMFIEMSMPDSRTCFSVDTSQL